MNFDQIGIVSIGLTRSGALEMVNGSIVLGTASFTWSDGHTGVAADVGLDYVLAGDPALVLIGIAPV
jgi:hypothetical protein